MSEESCPNKMLFKESLCNREISIFRQKLLFVSGKSLGQAVLGFIPGKHHPHQANPGEVY